MRIFNRYPVQYRISNNHIIYLSTSRFVPEKFEKIFKKHARTRPDALTGKELQEMLKANREPKDLKGW